MLGNYSIKDDNTGRQNEKKVVYMYIYVPEIRPPYPRVFSLLKHDFKLRIAPPCLNLEIDEV